MRRQERERHALWTELYLALARQPCCERLIFDLRRKASCAFARATGSGLLASGFGIGALPTGGTTVRLRVTSAKSCFVDPGRRADANAAQHPSAARACGGTSAEPPSGRPSLGEWPSLRQHVKCPQQIRGEPRHQFRQPPRSLRRNSDPIREGSTSTSKPVRRARARGQPPQISRALRRGLSARTPRPASLGNGSHGVEHRSLCPSAQSRRRRMTPAARRRRDQQRRSARRACRLADPPPAAAPTHRRIFGIRDSAKLIGNLFARLS